MWLITRQRMSGADLGEMIALLLEALTPGLLGRHEAWAHPHTLSGRQVDVLQDDRWVAIWECSLAHPGVQAAAGLAGRSGLALGMGLDRLLMLVKANSLRDRIYEALHQGTEYQWAQ